MAVDYLGIHLGTLEYIAILLFGLIIFLIIFIATEKQRQKRHKAEMHRKKMMHHQNLQHHQGLV
ncbi:MAG: hypothetical protein ACP5NZ_01175 [Nanobdellota archaeon]